MSNTENTTPAAPAEAVAAAAAWVVNMENGPERSRLYNGHLSRRLPVMRGGFRATDYTAADSWIVGQYTTALAAAAHTAVKSGDIGTVYRLELATGEITPFGHCDYEDESNLYVTIWQHEGQPVNVLRGTHFEPAYTTNERTFLDLMESATEDAESYVVFGTLVNTSEPHTNDSSAEALHGLDADGYPGECDCDTLTGWSTVTAPGSTIDEGGA